MGDEKLVIISVAVRGINDHVCVLLTDEDHAAVLARRYGQLSATLDAQSVASYMINCQALTVRDLQSITSKRSEPIRAAERLLDVVMSQPYIVYVCFMDALDETGHRHVRELIAGNSSQGKKRNVFTYSLPSVGPRADPGVQAVSPQVT